MGIHQSNDSSNTKIRTVDMIRNFTDIAFTDSVKKLQKKMVLAVTIAAWMG